MTLLTAFVVSVFSVVSDAKSDYLTYEELIQQIEAGRVESVTVDSYSSISGTLTKEGSKSDFHAYADTGSANDPLLNRLLKQHGVKIVVRDVGEARYHMPILGFIMFLAPIIGLILLVVINRRVGRILANQRNHPDSTHELAG